MRTTATDRLDRIVALAVRSHLPDRPQRLGFLPSYGFWRQEEVNDLTWVPRVIYVALVIFAMAMSDLPAYLVGLGIVVLMIVPHGLFERYVRRRARALRAAEDSAPA